MPREGTKTFLVKDLNNDKTRIEIRYAPGGDENQHRTMISIAYFIEIRYAPGGDENSQYLRNHHGLIIIEIRYAPGGDENFLTHIYRSGTDDNIEIRYAPGGDENVVSLPSAIP